MKPRTTSESDGDLFRARLDQVLDPTHPLVRLSKRIDWDEVERRVAVCYADQGRPGLSGRLMVGLHYLKHAFDESDESVCERWVENPPPEAGSTSAVRRSSATTCRSTHRV